MAIAQRTINNMWAIKLERPVWVGGDLEHQEMPEGIFRGPIKRIAIEEPTAKLARRVVVETEWTARRAMNRHGLGVGEWKLYTGPNATTFLYELDEISGLGPITSPPREHTRNRLTFTSNYNNIVATIFGRGTSKLDRSQVN